MLYYKAILFESSYEKKYFKLFHIKGYQTLIPRSLAILPHILKIKTFFNLIFPFLYLFWIFIMPLILIIKSIFLLLKPSKRININENIVYLNTSNPSNLTRINRKYETLPKASLFYRKRNIDSLDEIGISSYYIYDFLKKSNILVSLFYSLVFHFYIIFKKPGISLFSYSSFEFFSVVQAIKKIKNLESLWLSNQFDRWVILSTFFNNKNVVIVQHGNLKYKYDEANEVIFKLDTKITGISKVYCIDKQSEKLFRNFLDSTKIKYLIMEKLRNLGPWRKKGNQDIKILINIGYDDINFYKKVIENLIMKSSNIDIGVSYHPLQTNRIDRSDIWEIKNSNLMPAPDIYVSYGSSLDEYFKNDKNIRSIIYSKELIKTSDNLSNEISKYISE